MGVRGWEVEACGPVRDSGSDAAFPALYMRKSKLLKLGSIGDYYRGC